MLNHRSQIPGVHSVRSHDAGRPVVVLMAPSLFHRLPHPPPVRTARRSRGTWRQRATCPSRMTHPADKMWPAMTPIARVSAREFASDILRQAARLTGELLVKTLDFQRPIPVCGDCPMPHCVHASVGASPPLSLLCAIRFSVAVRSPHPPEARRRLPQQRHPGHPGTRFPESCTRSHCRTAPFYVSRARDGGVRCCTDSRRRPLDLACRRGIVAGIPVTPESVARRRAAAANATAPALYISRAFSRARDGGVRCCTDSRRRPLDLACRRGILAGIPATPESVARRRAATANAAAHLYVSRAVTRARGGGVRCCTDSRRPARDLACRTARLYVSRARVGVYGVYGAGV